MIDPDGDVVRCDYAAFVEVGSIKKAPPGVEVRNEVCSLAFYIIKTVLGNK